MIWSTVASVLVVAGAGLWIYIYHVRVAKIPLQHRKQVLDWSFYAYVDLYLKVSSLFFTVAALMTDWPWLLEMHDNAWLIAAGLFLCGGALTLFTWAMFTLDQQFSNAHHARLPTELVAAGPYRWIRHPIYTANVMLGTGLLIASGSAWLALNLLIVLVYYAVMVPIEERFLVKEFAEYELYRRRTGAIFPRLVRRSE